MLLSASAPQILGVVEGARLRFGEEPKGEGTWAGRRLLFLDERPAFDLTFWCGTCQLLFTRLDGANQTVSLKDAADRLADGLDGIDEAIVERFAELLPQGSYLPMLIEIEPRLVFPLDDDDYFANEQVATWNVERFWGLPHYPKTPYYRTFQTPVADHAHLYEFVVPMVPPNWNNAERVKELAERLTESSRPTAVAVSTLDISQPANGSAPNWYAHWGLTHFLLDGHHKLAAAAQIGKPVQLLSLLSLDASLASPEQIQRVPELLTRPAGPRPATT
ncbi:MAG: hypothetical protein K8R99_08815 [Actinomycetia bacterium]|nr:hypothetical protein [Actinomycetes bacterium]